MLKCWHYAQCFCLAIMLKIMLLFISLFISYIIIIKHSFLSREHVNPQLTCSQRQWLYSSVGRASHRYCEVTGSNPVEVLNFFQASLRNCINCVYCDNHFFILTTYKLVARCTHMPTSFVTNYRPHFCCTLNIKQLRET